METGPGKGNHVDSRINLVLNPTSFVPFYEQIAGQVRNMIREGKVRPGDTFCSEGEIAASLGVSKMPVRQAFQKLRSEGLLIIAQGRKPVIGAGRVPWNFQQLRGFSEEMSRRGLTPSARVLSMDLRDADSETAQALQLTDGQKVFRLKRLRFINSEPVAVVTSYLPAHLFAGLEQHDFERESLYHLIEGVFRRKLGWAEEAIGAVAAASEEAHILQTGVGSPLLCIRETTYDADKTLVEHSISLLRGDRYTAFVVSVRR